MYEYPEDYRHRIIDSWGNLLINCTFYRNFDTRSGRMGLYIYRYCSYGNNDYRRIGLEG